MYVYFEHHKDTAGKIAVTELRLSSYGDGRLGINFRSLSENTSFELCKSILKWPPIASRSYEDGPKVWTYLGDYGAQVLEKLEQVTAATGGIGKIEVEDLLEQCKQGGINLNKKKKQLRPEDFFYNAAPQGAAVLSKEQIAEKLAAIMQVAVPAIDKKAYRAAALKFHPDRNQGDGSKMSELNMLWQLYNV